MPNATATRQSYWELWKVTAAERLVRANGLSVSLRPMATIPSSPVTGGPVAEVDRFDVPTLIRRYQDEAGLDVTPYLQSLATLPLYDCRDTGYRFFHPPALAGEAEFYDLIWQAENRSQHRPEDLWRDDWQFALDRLKPGERVLDVGCAEGIFLSRAVKIAEVEGIDGNPEGARIAAAKGLPVRCSTVSEFADQHAGQFDKVVSFQVLEHIYDVATFVGGLKALVRPGGRIILSVPNSEPYYAGWAKYEPLNNPPHHIGLWNERSLRKMAEFFALRIVEVHYLGVPDRFSLQVYRLAAYFAGVFKPPNRITRSDFLKIMLSAPRAILQVARARLSRSKEHYAYVAIVLEK